MKSNNDFFWIDEHGRKWTGEQIKHKFDRFIKKAIKHRTRDAVRKLLMQNDHFPVQPDNVIQQVAVPFESSVEKLEFMLGSTRLFLDDERLVEALNLLTEREKLIFEKFYIEDYSDKAIGEWLHISILVNVLYCRIHAALSFSCFWTMSVLSHISFRPSNSWILLPISVAI